MTEPALDAAAPAAAPLTAGALLRAARERQGLHIAALAAAIKVSPKKLEALEADRWGELPDATFTRALAQTVCRTLKIDPKMVLDKMPAVEGVNLALTLPSETGSGGAPTRAGAVPPPRRRAGGVPGLAWGALLLLVGAGVLVFLPAGWTWRSVSPVPASAPAMPMVVAPVMAPPAAASEPASAALAASEAMSTSVVASAPLTAVPAPAMVAIATPAVPPATAQAVAPAPLPAATAAPAAADPGAALQLVASEDSWVEVRDASGRVLLSRLVAAGERLVLDGTAPLKATIGNVAGTQVSWRGQAIDLAARHQGNVARLELP